MSEEILKALTQLFAIITKQDGSVTEEEHEYVRNFFQMELDRDSVMEYLSMYEKAVAYESEDPHYKKQASHKKASVRDTVRTLNLSKKINRTLSQKQKVIVLLRLLELLKADNSLTPLGVEIIDTMSTIFNVPLGEYNLLKQYVKYNEIAELNDQNFLIGARVNGQSKVETDSRFQEINIDGEIVIVRLESVNMFFIKYQGAEEINLNGFRMMTNLAYLLSPGSTIKSPQGRSSYYSDIARLFESPSKLNKISFEAKHINFIFPNGGHGLRNVNISEKTGSLVGIMGASGSGKTTLLNVLAGIEKPSSGKIRINGIDLHKDKDQLDGVVGYVSQDDILIEELSVYQNLYYNAKLSLSHLSEKELHKEVMTTLESLGLEFTSELKVGSVLEKTISGGQRKRLNIALELIRQPSILFVDEPTSGLSSRDSENVMDLLKELSQKGKVIFVVIHQPSSDIYKMFDKIIVMDTGGYMIYYGNPVEAITYFKEVTHQIDRFRGICHNCGNLTPEQIFNIVEARVVNEYGQFTSKRKITPTQWFGLYQENFELQKVPEIKESPPKSLNRPGYIKQIGIFITRDFLSKISDKQYMLINILEAPVLALVLALVIRYKNSPDGSEYVFRFNDNIPAFLMMSIVVALFLGLTVSAEEIIRDRKILKREQFLNLSWSGYLISKLTILFVLSAAQTLMFVLIGNYILEIKGMTFMFWAIMFSSSCMANIVGLNVSSAFKSAITVYILIPIILIPQLIFSGLLFSFDKLNDAISSEGRVPVIADFITSRWAFEAMTVHQFMQNEYEKPFYEFDQEIKQSEFKSSFWIPEVRNKTHFVSNNFFMKNDTLLQEEVKSELNFIINELKKEPFVPEDADFSLDSVTYEKLSPRFFLSLNQYLNGINSHYVEKANLAIRKKDKLISLFESDERYDYDLSTYMNDYFNESLSDLVRNINVKNRILETEKGFIQQLDAIFHVPELSGKALDYRSHFYAPQKHFFNHYFSTPLFNIAAIWAMTLFFFLTVYLKIPEKVIKLFGR
jgi:ABC-type multidrug transport system ATPase subunit